MNLDFENARDAPVFGVDEAGIGPWAGPVIAAAAWLDPSRTTPDFLAALNDSKKLSSAKRSALVHAIHAAGIACWGEASLEEIDQLNILRASHLAMQRAVNELCAQLGRQPKLVVIDGNKIPAWHWPSEAIIGGDGMVASIAAASIIAKEARDKIMREIDAHHPEYGFARHMGYGTRQHRTALERHGAAPVHRKTFRPIQEIIHKKQAV